MSIRGERPPWTQRTAEEVLRRDPPEDEVAEVPGAPRRDGVEGIGEDEGSGFAGEALGMALLEGVERDCECCWEEARGKREMTSPLELRTSISISCWSGS